MRILTQLCAIELLVVIFILCGVQRKIGLRSQKFFKYILYIVIICVCLDIISVIAIQNRNYVPELLVKIICKAYLLTLVSGACFCFSYFTSELVLINANSNKVRAILGTYALLCTMTIAVLPIYFHDEEDGLYTYGPSVVLTYFVALFVLLMNIIVLVRNRKYVNATRRHVGLIWMIIWVISALIQFCFNELLVVSYACAIGVAILYMLMENPAQYCDRETGFLNQHTLKQYFKEKVNAEHDANLIVISIENADRLIERKVNKYFLSSFGVFLENISDVTVFKNPGWEYVLWLEKPERMHEIALIIQERFERPWEFENEIINVEARIYEMPQLVCDSEDVYQLIYQFIYEMRRIPNQQIFQRNQEWIMKDTNKKKMEKMIYEGIYHGKLEIVYQPIYNKAEKQFTAAEAYVRLLDAEGNYMYPDEFLESAEVTGSIIPLGDIVFVKIFEFINRVSLKNLGIEHISINLSPMQCTQKDFPEKLISLLQLHGIDPSVILLEITEASILKSKEILVENMRKLIQYGVSFALDDFGTGYSNLDYVLELPIKIVKLDRKVTTAYITNENSRIMIEPAIKMIHSLNMDVSAECIETKEESMILEEKEINYLQGRYYANPMKEQDFVKFIEIVREKNS